MDLWMTVDLNPQAATVVWRYPLGERVDLIGAATKTNMFHYCASVITD